MPRRQLEELQLLRLKQTLARVYDNVGIYRSRMQQADVVPEDICTLDDIGCLPFMQKADLRSAYPYGLFAADRREIVRLHASSGTTGKPIIAGYTKSDIAMWSEVVARCMGCAHIDASDTIQVSYGYGLFTGGLGVHYGAEKVGAQVLPTSAGNTQRQLMLMRDLGVTVLACTPSYALLLGERMREEGVEDGSLKLNKGIFGAEPWTEEMRERIQQMLGITALDIYGLTEIIGPGVAMECMEARHGLHIWEDHFLIEILHPETHERVPDGETGELVISTLTKQGMPILRYQTHDLTSIIPEPCPCGRTHRRIQRLKGRTDDMLIIRGVNVFPSQVEAAIANLEGISPRYMLLVDRVNNLDTLRVQVELAPDFIFDEVSAVQRLNRRVQKAVEQTIGLSIELQLVEPGSIERSEGKSRRVVDSRRLYEEK